MMVKEYSPYMRRLGVRLRRRTQPRSQPRTLHFIEQQFPSDGRFKYRAIATIESDSDVSSGYVVVEFDGPIASAACDFVDSTLIFGNEPGIDNRELAEYLQEARKLGGPLPYALAIGKTPLARNRPIHVEAYGAKPIHIAKVTLFDE